MRSLFLLFLLCFGLKVCAQEYSFSTYSEAQGINQPYIYDIQQSEKGFLYFTTSEGAFTYDGASFERVDRDGKVNEPFFKSLLIDGEVTYLGSNTGGIYAYENGKIKLKYTNKSHTSPVVDILKSNGKIYAFAQNGKIFVINNSEVLQKGELPGGHIYTEFTFFKDRFVAAYDEGIALFTLKSGKVELFETLIVNDAVESLGIFNNSLVLGTTSSGLFIFEDNKLSPIELSEEFKSSQIKSIYSAELSSFWISVYGKGIYEIKKNTSNGKFYVRSNLTPAKGLPSDYITKLFIDRESNMWLGSFGQGLSKLNSSYLIHYNLDKYGLGNYVYSVFSHQQQYCGMDGGILVINTRNDSIFPWQYNNQLPEGKIKAINYSKDRDIWFIGTENNGVYVLEGKSKKLKYLELSDDNLSKSINHISVIDDRLFISTLNGLYVQDLNDKTIIRYSSSEGLPHNTVNSTLRKSDGRIYIATLANSLFYLQDGKIHEHKIRNTFGTLDINSFVEDRKGSLWIATNGQGLFRLNGKEFVRISATDGLHSDYIYQLILDKKNTLWGGHRGGLSRIREDGLKMTTFDYRNDIAMDFLINSVSPDKMNNIWFGTSEGVIQYAILQDKYFNYQAKPVLISLTVNDSLHPNGNIIELDYRKNKIRAVFRTVSLSQPGEVYYQYRLRNFDNKWSEPSKENSATFNQLLDGEYVLEVRSRIGNGDWITNTQMLRINVPEPIWKKWWFSILGLLLIVVLISFAVNFRTRSLRKQKVRLEEILKFRTAEIQQQRNQIEMQYKETQDSIDYGVRIQSSLMPEVRKLQKSIPDSFIFFRPKDKVSGDFYYFEQFGKHLIIAASDATGHGVPGAFISLIGFVTLKEVVHRPDIDAPHKLLRELDYELNTTLKQFNRKDDGKDGMDMAVCEINLETQYIRMASALRPIWIFSDGKFEKIRSSRASVGGGYDYSTDGKKEFDLEEKQLKSGDTIYLFSDGYVDQFGSEKNKKLMSKRFLKLIKEINHLPMIEQQVIISDFLTEWMGAHEQTDDIMVIGMRL